MASVSDTAGETGVVGSVSAGGSVATEGVASVLDTAGETGVVGSVSAGGLVATEGGVCP